jgi:hypothetical protein
MIDTTAKLRYTLPATETSVVGFCSLYENAVKSRNSIKALRLFCSYYLLGWGEREGASPAGTHRVPPVCKPVHSARLHFAAKAWLNHKGTTV